MSQIPAQIKQELGKPFKLSQDAIDYYRENGFVKLKNVLSAEAIQYMDKTISAEVVRLNTQHLPMEERDTYGKAFLQIMNIWTRSALVKEIVFSKRLAKIATDLMGVGGVRMYHDQALFKEPGGGHTPWHADQYYWPLSNDNTVTAWIPLQATGLELGPVEFSAKSQQLQEGRTLKISDDSETVIQKKLTLNDFKKVVEPFETGDVSFHSGWVFHRAGANTTKNMRKVMTVIYMDKDMQLKAPANDNQQADWDTWCPGAVIGEQIDTPLNPILFEN
ncbi:MAG TPA: phytanoyl-CoA dioxygenase family protein [Chitinophagaceae bacterium]|nr:phytanoyl-CoA dioxygenase family protein [Chitinophagaceae bacterium]